MIRGLYTSSAGMQVEALRQEAIANNLANANTAGFRRDLAIMEARKGLKLKRTNVPTSNDPLAHTKRVPIGTLGTGVVVERMVKDFKQGDMRQTENPYDLALQGKGFFTLQSSTGETLYTREGQFTRSGDGRLVDKVGNALMGSNGPIIVNGKFQVGEDGSYAIDGQTVGRLALADFAEPDLDLEKRGDTAFRFNTAGGRQPGVPDKVAVYQGTLEAANVNSVHEMVDMITALRQYEANQKAVQSQDETLSRAVNDIAK